MNKMGVPNIAMIFGPTLMSNENVSIHFFSLGTKGAKLSYIKCAGFAFLRL